ncbi:MAG: hypothetical protein JXA22_01515 [Candidatus Thermoplasmatota archaeon]|nr:hypothetical protein [Candidatus Thermoplasmatota archaeon]
MEGPVELWDDIEEFFEKVRVRRRQFTGGDIEDEIALRGKTMLYLMDEAYDMMDENLQKIYERIMDGVYDLGLGARGDFDDVADGIRGLREHIEEKRKNIKDENDKYGESELLDEIQERLSNIRRKLKD